MVFVFNKDLLSWYLITLKLNEAVKARTPRLQDPTNSTRSIELATESEQNLLQKEQNEQSDSVQITLNDRNISVQDGLKSPESDWLISIREKLEQARHEDDGSWAKLLLR